jgi:hypothetical protein
MSRRFQTLRTAGTQATLSAVMDHGNRVRKRENALREESELLNGFPSS